MNLATLHPADGLRTPHARPPKAAEPHLLILTDVHCRFQVINQQVAYAEEVLNRRVDEVVVLGDFGLFEPHLKRFLRPPGPGFSRPVQFIEGNHEDFDHFETLAKRYLPALRHLPRGTVWQHGGRGFLCLGGAAYMDATSTPWQALVQPADIDACLAIPPAQVEIILSHDCPSGIGLRNSPGFEDYGPPGFPGGDRLARHFTPRLWLFGHHHRLFDRDLDGTRYCGLPQSWKGFGLLDANGNFQPFVHELPLPPPPTWFASLANRWRRHP